MPTISKMPTKARSPAAVTSDMPWSIDAGIRCVPINPLVVAPQMKKLPASSQKSRDRTPMRRPPNARAIGFSVLRHRGVIVGRAVWPKADVARVVAHENRHEGGDQQCAAATAIAAQRQPTWTTSQASSGRKINCPVALAALRTPSTVPRRATNQRLATVAAKTDAIIPVPAPATTPQRRSNCQGARMKMVSEEPAATQSRAITTTRRNPNRSDEGGCEGAAEAKEDEVDGDGERDHRTIPAKLLLQGRDQDARRGPESGRAEQGEKRHGGDDPGIVQTGGPQTRNH